MFIFCVEKIVNFLGIPPVYIRSHLVVVLVLEAHILVQHYQGSLKIMPHLFRI